VGRAERLSYRQIRSVTELVGQCVELGRNPAAWRTHALQNLTRLTGGQVGLTIDIQGLAEDSMPRMFDPIDIGWDDRARQVFYGDYPAVMAEDPGTQALGRVHTRARFSTTTRRELVGDHEWYTAPAVSELRRSGDVDDLVSTSVMIRPGVVHGFIVYRRWQQTPFGVRERRIMRLFQAGLLRQLRRHPEEHALNQQIAALPPRVRQTMNRLVAGESLKEIADGLKISRHTVNDYTKVLHKRFGVSSRAQLVGLLAKRQSPGLVLPAGMFPSDGD
jgi:DNA-binding CsgD family transcriptional regulator